MKNTIVVVNKNATSSLSFFQADGLSVTNTQACKKRLPKGEVTRSA